MPGPPRRLKAFRNLVLTCGHALARNAVVKVPPKFQHQAGSGRTPLYCPECGKLSYSLKKGLGR